MTETVATSPAKNPYTLVVGMEVHAELKTKSKMFCGCKNDPFGAESPNIYTCPVCLGMPGGIPVPNKKAIEWTIKLGLALNCKIHLFSHFDRKNYFYPDLPKGYQISQYDQPFCYGGVLATDEGPVRIRRIHLEEDTGKLIHRTVDGKKVSMIDFNRGGVPLVEIVTEPDIHTPTHAKAYAKTLRQVLRFLDIADCDMEQGGMRLEANISLSPLSVGELEKCGESALPKYKSELKNINSFRFMEKAIAYEVRRQGVMLDRGETPIQETRGWNETKGQTFSQRVKEDAEDYRYFPDPDIPPMRFTEEQIEKWRAELPELPADRRRRWEQAGVEAKYSLILTEEKEVSDWVDAVFTEAAKVKIQVNEIAKALVNKKIPVDTSLPSEKVVHAFASVFQIEEVDVVKLMTVIEKVLAENPEIVKSYKAGKVQVIGFLIGKVRAVVGKNVSPKVIQEHLAAKLI